MATIRPFAGIRPAPQYARDVAALPYDVMNTQEAREMVEGKPYSFLHIDRAEIDLPESTDPYSPEVYAQAAKKLQQMREAGIFLQDIKPCFYIYRLTMDGRAQTGLVVCTSIDEYLDGTIKKHELTRAEKEADRIRHVDALNANTGPIFLAYRGKEAIDAILHEETKKESIYHFVAADGIEHEVWLIAQEDTIAALIKAFAEVPNLYIADGHHRNASAVKVGLKRRAEHPDYTGEEEFNYYLSVLFASDELYILDYNRVVKDLNGLSKVEFLQKLADKFDVTVVADGPCTPPQRHSFGMYLDKQWYLLHAKPEILTDDPVDGLDVSILQNNVLTPLLAIGDPRTDARIDFVGGIRGLLELEKRVDSGEMQLAFAMYPTAMEELMGVADAGLLMPPKSTWFEPKLRSGLFIHEL